MCWELFFNGLYFINIFRSFTTPVLSVSSLMAKQARSLMENGVRYYVAKH